MNNIYDVKQFKLTSGDEIVCDVIDWPVIDSKDLVVRNCMQIVKITHSLNEQYYIFRPWIHYLESSDDLTIISSNHIISVSNPNKLLFEQYIYAVKEMHLTAKERYDDWKEDQKNYLSKVAEQLSNIMHNKDSSESNIIKFPVH